MGALTIAGTAIEDGTILAILAKPGPGHPITKLLIIFGQQ